MCNQITLAEHCTRPRQISEGCDAYVTAALLGGIPPAQSQPCSEAWSTAPSFSQLDSQGCPEGEVLPWALQDTDQRRTPGLPSRSGRSGVAKTANGVAVPRMKGLAGGGSTWPRPGRCGCVFLNSSTDRDEKAACTGPWGHFF